MRILFISRWFPYPPDNGSKLRAWNLIKHLALRHEIDLISFVSEAVGEERLGAMRGFCRRVDTVLYRPFCPTRLRAVLGFFSPLPRSVIDTHSAEMQRLVEQAVRIRPYDLVVASQIDMAAYARNLRQPKIFEEVQLAVVYDEFASQRHPLKKLRRGLTWWKQARYTASLVRDFDGCTVVSEQERALVLRLYPGSPSIEVIPNGADVANSMGTDLGAPEADTLIYSGPLTYQANLDAVDFFLREIFPLILSERPNAKFYITGKLDGVPLERLSVNDNVVFTGYLDDIRSAVARAWVSVVPLRIGGGTRLKILEALALGTPVVATRKGAEGLDLVSGHDLLIADAPADFAAAVLDVLRDCDWRRTLGQHGRQSVVDKYDWRVIAPRFTEFIEARV